MDGSAAFPSDPPARAGRWLVRIGAGAMIAGMCMIVALPIRGIGTGMSPRRVAPRKSATPPTTPATTICRVPSPEVPPLPPAFAAT